MAIKIQTKNVVIPVQFGDLTFEFNTADDRLNEFYEKWSALQTENEKIEKRLREEGAYAEKEYEAAKDLMKGAFDSALGEGAFEKIYEKFPSMYLMFDYLMQLALGIKEELDARGFHEKKYEKYLQPQNGNKGRKQNYKRR